MNKALFTLIISSIAVTTVTAPVARADDHPVEVTHGRFETLSGGADLGYHIRGRAIMFRTDADGGTTTVHVRVRGLEPGTTYKTHVHNAPCSATPSGGGHYQHDVGGVVDPVNEIWPTITTDDRGRGVGHAVHGHRARADARAIVIHEVTDSSIRIACLDLS